MYRRKFLGAASTVSLAPLSGCAVQRVWSTPRIAREYSASGQDKPVVSGQPTVAEGEEKIWGRMITSREQAESEVQWDNWVLEGGLQKYRETDFSDGLLVFVVGVLPTDYDLDARGIEYTQDSLRYRYGKIKVDSRDSASDEQLHYVYNIDKWDLNGHPTPDEFELEDVEGTPTPPEG